LSRDIFGWHRERHEVPVGKQFGVADTERTLPAVHKTSLHVDEPRFVVVRRKQRVAVETQLWVVVDESVAVVFGPGHDGSSTGTRIRKLTHRAGGQRCLAPLPPPQSGTRSETLGIGAWHPCPPPLNPVLAAKLCCRAQDRPWPESRAAVARAHPC